MIKFHQKFLIYLHPFEDINTDQISHTNQSFTIFRNIENKLTCFQLYPDTEFAFKYKNHYTKHNIQKFFSNTKMVST